MPRRRKVGKQMGPCGGGEVACMVCCHRPATGLYADERGWLLQACSNPWCTVGYTYLFPYEVMVTLRRAFGREATRDALAMFRGPGGPGKSQKADITQYQ